MELQNNEREISPINTWVNGMVKSGNILMINAFISYDFLGGTSLISYSIVNESRQAIAGGDVNIPFSVVNQWGADDQIIFDYVAQQLNLILV